MKILQFEDLSPNDDNYASQVVDRILNSAIAAGASDVHLTQQQGSILLRWRVHGKLIDLGHVSDGSSTNILGRIKALAHLVTYRSDAPQEGRLVLNSPDAKQNVEARVGTIPTLHGERAVVRLSLSHSENLLPEQLGLPEMASQKLESACATASGVILIVGPAGSGKTTTAYSALRQICQAKKLRSVVSLEDPVECELANVAQSQVNPEAGYDWFSGLKALLRQDPEVMLVGEIRDAETAAVVFQAAMTGQLVISTMHARSCADGLRRLLDMNVPSQHLTCALNFLVCQRLLPEVCKCQRIASPSLHDPPSSSEQQRAVDVVSSAEGVCSTCSGTGTSGRKLLAELLPTIESDLARSLVADASAGEIHRVAESLGMQSLSKLADEQVKNGRVSPIDVQCSIS